MTSRIFWQKWLRNLRLMSFADRIRYAIHFIRHRSKNKEYQRKHSDRSIPPDYLIYESYKLDYQGYYEGGREAAEWIRDLIGSYDSLKGVSILDWGCGPGRIVRHLREFVGGDAKIYGVDTNERSIAWCEENVPDVRFHLNSLDAKLPFEDNFFDIIYGISILTHLSDESIRFWYRELMRVLKPEGILLFTTQGRSFASKLSPKELQQFDQGMLISRANVTEGHRVYSTFHPPTYVEELVKNAVLLTHISGTQSAILPAQDVWIVKKPIHV